MWLPALKPVTNRLQWLATSSGQGMPQCRMRLLFLVQLYAVDAMVGVCKLLPLYLCASCCLACSPLLITWVAVVSGV